MLHDLNPGCFQYDNYESNWWSLFDLSYDDSICTKSLAEAIKEYATGFCKGEYLLFKPRNDSMAVMFEKEQNRFWFHIPDWQFHDIFGNEHITESSNSGGNNESRIPE